MLETFLNNKPLFYDEIDYGRMPRVYASLKNTLKIPKIIHIVGTNGKGTTGRFLATALYSIGYKVGHYTSPHIISFNERIWKNGQNIETKELEEAHKELLSLLSEDDANALSYFEYTTFLALLLYKEMDYLVLEAGLGGEHDATAVFPNILTLVTPIDIDHEAFLGDDIESIATTKLNAIQKEALLAKQKRDAVYSVAKGLEIKKGIKTYSLDSFLSDVDYEKIEQISQENNLVEYLKDNVSLAVATLNYLGLSYEVQNFQESRLYGRVTQLQENIILDVGHNVLAAKSIQKSLEGKKYTLIYNSYKDKNYKEILSILQPIIKEVELIEVDDARVESMDVMQEVIENLSLECSLFQKIEKSKEYLVFGSFSVVEAFLKVYYE